MSFCTIDYTACFMDCCRETSEQYCGQSKSKTMHRWDSYGDRAAKNSTFTRTNNTGNRTSSSV